MFNYVDANQVSEAGFTILDKPVKIYRGSYEYGKSDHGELPNNLTCYLVDETKAPYSKVQDVDGNEINNLVTFGLEIKNAKVMFGGEVKEITHLEYNFFNWPADGSQEKADGTIEIVRRKWLNSKYRANVVFTKPVSAEVWDKEAKERVVKEVTHAKLDIPAGVFGTILDTFENTREALEHDMDAPIPFPSFEVSFEFDGTAAAADMYTKVKVKALKEPVDGTKQLKEFKVVKSPFEPPAAPY